MKRKVIALIIILSTILSLFQPITLADEEAKGISQDTYNSITKDGTANVKSSGNTGKENLTYSITQGAVGANVLVNLGNVIATAIESMLTVATVDGFSSFEVFTIYNVVFNKVNMFDANYLIDNGNTNNIHQNIKSNIITWYYSIRNLAIALSLVVLIYIGIRMTIATLANDKARYKKMLISWLESFILIFFLHYLIIISMYLSQTMLIIIKKLAGSQPLYEYVIMISSYIASMTKFGWDAVPHALVYWVLVYYQLKFFWLYMKRMLSVAFLIIISPLITVTYSIDKAGDGRAQAFNAWVKEFEVNMFVQPLHALLYVMFIVSAAAIAGKAPLLYALFFMALSRGEKIIKSIFSARGMKSIGSMGKGKGKKIL